MAATPIPEAEPPAPSRPGEVTFGLGISDQEVTESFDTLFPLAVPKNGLLFINPKLSLSDELDARVSIGLGYRHLFPGSNIIVGANVFYDSFDSIHDHRINQFGAGVEVMSRWVDFRANFYLPEQDRRTIAKTESVDISRKASESTQALGPRITSQNLAFQGNNILQNTIGANDTLHTVNLRETETTRFWERYEAGMRGGDAEIGFLIPGLDRYADVRVFGGYYFYENDFGKDVNGFKGRLEVRALPAVTFDAMYYDDKEVIGSNWFYGMRISAPFDLANISNHRSPFAGFTDAFKPKSQVDEKQLFASRMTENIMRTSRVTTSESKFIQTGVKKEVYQGKTTYVTSTAFNSSTILTLGGAPITVTHADANAAPGPGNGTFESPYLTLGLADADAVKRNIVFLHADSAFVGSITLAPGQQLLGDAANLTHFITSDQGTLALPHANGTAAPTITNPGGAIINVVDNSVVSGVNLSGAARGIYAAAGANNVTITNSTISNMTTAGIEIKPSNGTTIDNVTFNGNFQDVVLNAFNTKITNVTSNNATNGAFDLSNTTGTTTITNVTINGAGLFGMRFTNPGGTHNITNLDITGGTGSGVEIVGGGGTFAFDSTSSITNTGSTPFKLDGGTASVTYNGTLSENNNTPLVSVLNGHTGTATFNGALTATNGQGLLFDNADGTYNFLGTTTLNGGDAGIDIVNGSDGTFAFGAGTAITNPSGQSIFVNGGTASLMYAGTVADNTGATIEVLNHTTGTISFLAGSTITASGGTGLQFTNDSGTYNFLGTTTMNGGDAGIDILASNGTFNFDTGTTVTNPTGTGFFLSGGQANVTYLGNVSDNSGFALQVVGHSVGTLNFNTGTVTSTGGLGVQFVNDSGTYNLASVTVTNSSGSGLEVTASPTGTFAFGSLTVTTTAGTGVQLNNAGTVSILGGSINGTGGNGIFSQNTALTVTGTSIGNTVALNIAGIGIEVQNTDGTARLVNLSNNNIRSTGSAIQTTDNGAAGGLTLILDGDTYETLAPGSKALNITGSGLNSTTIRSMSGGTVVGNGNGGGLYFTRVTFDGDGVTVGNQQVSGGVWNIGQGVANRVFNDGLHLDGPSGVLAFTTLNIFNNAGTGLFVDTKALGTTFALGNTGGTIDTTNGAAMDIDPLATNLTLASVTSTNSGTSGVIVDTLAAGSTLTIGTTTVSNSTGDGIVVRASAGSTINFGNTTVTNAGQDGIDLGQAGNANITFGTTNINGFGAANAGVNFNGSDATATFGVTTIQNGGNGTAIDLSNTQNGRVITFATGSSISNVAIGVQLSSGGTTATSANANFTFGDGSGVDANGKNSNISATTTVAAIGLNPALGTYNFQDVNFTGAFLFPASPGALFVSVTAVNGAGDGSFANPFSVSDADAITTAGSTFAFLDGTYNFAALNAGLAFSLNAGQAVTGLDNGNVITFGTVKPANVLGDFGVLGGSVTRTGGGTLSITNGTAGGGVFTLFGGNNVTNITVTGAGGANDPATLFSSDGLAVGFNNAAGITLSGVTIGNLQAGATALAFSNMTDSVQVTGNNIDTTAGTLLSVNGGTANYTITKGATGTLTGTAIDIRGTVGGSVAVTDATLNTNGNTAVTLNGNGATTTFTNIAIARTAGDTAFDIDATVASTGKVTVAGTSNIGSTAGTAFKIGGGGRDIDASALNFTNAGTTAANVIVSTGQTGGTISFGNVGITGFNNAAGTAVNLQGSGGTVSFADLDVTTTNGAGVNVGAITFAPGSTSTISATGGTALALSGTTLSGGTATFASVSATNTGAGNAGVSLTNVTGATTFTTVALSNTFYGLLFDNAGSVTVNGGTINGTTGNAVGIVNTAFALNSLSIGATATTFGDAVHVEMNDGIARTSSVNGLTTNLVAGTGIEFDNFSAGVQTFSVTNSTLHSTGSLGMRVLINAAGGNVNVAANNNTFTLGGLLMDAQGAPGTLTVTSFLNNNVVKSSGSGMEFRAVTFDADLATAGFQQVSGGNTTIGNSLATTDIVGFGLRLFNSKGNLGFGTLNIYNDTGTGLSIRPLPGDSVTFANTAGVINTTNGAAMDVNSVTFNSTFTSVSSTNAFQYGIDIDTVTGTLNLGNVNVSGAAQAGLRMVASSATVTAGALTISNTPTGLLFGNNVGGSFTATGATNISGITSTGIDANGARGTYKFAALTVGFTGAGRGIDFRNSSVQFESDTTSITGDGTVGSIAIDLSGSQNPNGANSTTPNILMAKDGGETASIGNVATGVLMGTPGSSAGAYFVYGNQTTPSSGSSISVIAGGVTLDTTNLTSTDGFTQGRYEFAGVSFTGQASFEGAASTDFIFVGTNRGAVPNGTSPANRYGIAQGDLATVVNFAAQSGKTIIFVNDDSVTGIDFGATTLSLGANTSLLGFGNNATVNVPGGVQPVNVIGTFNVGGASYNDGNIGAGLTGAAIVRSSTTTVILNTATHTLGNFNLGNATTALSGTNFGTLTINGLLINNTTGGAVSLNTGTLAGTGLTSVTSTGGTNGISLTNVAGTMNFGSGAISGTTGSAFAVSGGNAVLSYGGSLTNTAGRAVSLQTITGGSVTLSGSINSTGASTGILVQNNTGGTFTFSGTTKTLNTGANQAVTLASNGGATINFTGGGLGITTASGIGFGATGVGPAATTGGTVTVTGSNNTISSSTGTALNIVNATIGASGLNFQSITSSGASTNAGIILDNTGSSGGLTVTGTGTNGSGGTIANKTGGNVTTGNADDTVTISGTSGIGIFLRNTANVSLNYMLLNTFTNYAILGSSVTNFTMTHTTVSGVNGNQAGIEDSITFNNLLGSALIDTSNISGGFVDNLRVVNNTGTLNRLTVSNTTFGATSSNVIPGGQSRDSFFFGARSNAVANVTVSNSTFQGAVGDNFQADATGTSTMDVVFTGNTVNTSLVTPAQGGGGMLISGGGSGSAPTVTFDIESNNLSGALTSEINVSFLGTATGGSFHGSILNNTTGVSGVAASGGSSGIEIFSGGPLFTVTVSGNTMQQYSQIGLFVHASQVPNNAVMNATITNNIVRQPFDDGLGSLFAGVDFDIGNPTDQVTLNLLFSGNNVGGSAGTVGIADVLLGNGPSSTINVSKNGNNTTPVEALIQALNPTGAPTVDTSNIQGVINIVVPAPAQ